MDVSEFKVPNGWKLAPEEPTREMFVAANKADDIGADNEDIWRAMLAAAPAAPTADGTSSDKYRAELYDEVWQRARDMGYGNATDALVELERLKAAAPAVQAEQKRDTFNGDNSALIRSAKSLLELDAKGALAPHGIGEHARGIISAFVARMGAKQDTVAYQCHNCSAQTPPPAPFKAYVECKECGEKTAATAAAELARPAAPPAHPDASVLVEALEQFADDSNWCYDTCDISRDVAKRSLAAYRAALAGKGGE